MSVREITTNKYCGMCTVNFIQSVLSYHKLFNVGGQLDQFTEQW